MQSGNKGGFRVVVAWIGGSKPPPYDMQEIRMDKAVFRGVVGVAGKGANAFFKKGFAMCRVFFKKV